MPRMKSPLILFAIALVLTIGTAQAQTTMPAAGVALELAQRRAEIVSNLSYELALSIPETLARPVTGSNTIRFVLAEAQDPLVLDFVPGPDHIFAVEANGQPAAYTQVNGHIVVAAAA
ncbi:MAG: hypothetical protein NTY41_08045, partial [Proteobacteria bacterium]|nr:hypothetical protein [Pseudomonadota bacterium]